MGSGGVWVLGVVVCLLVFGSQGGSAMDGEKIGGRGVMGEGVLYGLLRRGLGREGKGDKEVGWGGRWRDNALCGTKGRCCEWG